MVRNDKYLQFRSAPSCLKRATGGRGGERLPEERKEVNRSKHIAYVFNHLCLTENLSTNHLTKASCPFSQHIISALRRLQLFAGLL